MRVRRKSAALRAIACRADVSSIPGTDRDRAQKKPSSKKAAQMMPTARFSGPRRNWLRKKTGSSRKGRRRPLQAPADEAETAVPATTPAVKMTDRASMLLVPAIRAKLAIISYLCMTY